MISAVSIKKVKDENFKDYFFPIDYFNCYFFM